MKLPTSVFVAERNRNTGTVSIRVHPGKDIIQTPHFNADLDIIRSLSPDNLLIPLVDHNGWKILEVLVTSDRVGRLVDLAAEPTSGEIIFNVTTHPYMSREKKPGYELILRGSHVQRYEMVEEAKQGETEYLNVKAYLENSREESKAYAYKSDRIVYQEGSAIDAWRRVVPAYLPEGNICGHKICYFTSYRIDKMALLAVFASNLVNWLVEKLSVTNSLPAYLIGNLPFPRIDFTTPANQRDVLTRSLIAHYNSGEHTNVLNTVQAHLDADITDVIHDLLTYLAEQMIDLNKQKQAEVKRFLGWLEGTLKIQRGKDGETGIETFTGKSILQNYLGDYQKGELELPWVDFEYRLYQNRNRFKASLTDLKGTIQTEYEKSLAVLLPIKQRLEQTDRLIDQIVYKLYGLTDEEIELIERPQYEQAVTEAKAAVKADEELAKDENVEAAFEYIAAQIEPAAARLAVMSPSASAEAALDAAFPAWRSLPERVQILLSAAERDYLDETRLDYTGSEINYAKAVEVTLTERLFVPFREAGYTEDDVANVVAFKPFMRGERSLGLGNFRFLLSTREPTFLSFVASLYPDIRRRADEIVALLSAEQRASRNKSAHEDIVERDRAGIAREWALSVLELLVIAD